MPPNNSRLPKYCFAVLKTPTCPKSSLWHSFISSVLLDTSSFVLFVNHDVARPLLFCFCSFEIGNIFTVSSDPSLLFHFAVLRFLGNISAICSPPTLAKPFYCSTFKMPLLQLVKTLSDSQDVSIVCTSSKLFHCLTVFQFEMPDTFFVPTINLSIQQYLLYPLNC